MNTPTIFVEKKTIFVEILVLVLFLVGFYYLYTIFKEPDSITTQSSVKQELLGPNFATFLKALNQEKLSFKERPSMNSALVNQLQDFSEPIGPTEFRGRLDPFTPYAPTRPIR